MNRVTFRQIIAFSCIAAAVGIHYAGTVDFYTGLFIWLGLAAGASYMLPYGWMVAFAPVPWILGVGGGVLLGRYDGFEEAWYFTLAMSTIAGTIGFIMGAAARKNSTRSQAEDSSSP